MNILFFAALRETLGESLEVDVTPPLTVSELRQALAEALPEHASLFAPARTLSAVNQTICQGDTLINAGDEVAFFPPVTGG